MIRRALLAALVAAAAARVLVPAGAVRAQDAPAELPPEPAPAPPAPPRLALDGAAVVPMPAPPGPPLPSGMEELADGVVRLVFGGTAPEPAQAVALAALGRRLATLPAGRITIESLVSGPANDVSMARRASLARAQAVKAALVAGGLDATRIDLRPLGRTGAVADRVDVLPPGVASPNAEVRAR